MLFIYSWVQNKQRAEAGGGGHNKCVGGGEEGVEHYIKSNKSNKQEGVGISGGRGWCEKGYFKRDPILTNYLHDFTIK